VVFTRSSAICADVEDVAEVEKTSSLTARTLNRYRVPGFRFSTRKPVALASAAPTFSHVAPPSRLMAMPVAGFVGRIVLPGQIHGRDLMLAWRFVGRAGTDIVVTSTMFE